ATPSGQRVVPRSCEGRWEDGCKLGPNRYCAVQELAAQDLKMAAMAPIFMPLNHSIRFQMWRFFMPAPQEPQDPKQQDPAVDTSEQMEINQEQSASDDAAQPFPEAEARTDLEWATLLSETQEKVAQYHDELLRAKAEAENIRRRAQDDVAKARKFGTESFAESLIPVKDSLEAALALTEQTAD